MKTRTIILSLFVAVVPTIALAQQPQQAPPVIVVSSTADLQAALTKPRFAWALFGRRRRLRPAQDQTNRAVQAILAEISKLGVPAQKIQTSRLTLSPIYGAQRPDNREAPRVVAYNATNTVVIDLDNLARIGPVIDAGLTAGANQLEGVRFRLKDDFADSREGVAPGRSGSEAKGRGHG
jgi:uncharacterized protein YggE